MRQNRCHGVREHRMSTRKRSIDHVMFPEISVPVAFARSLSGSNELHGGVNQERIHQRFQFEKARFPRMPVFITLQPVNPYSRQRSRKPSDSKVRCVLIELVMCIPDVAFNVPVGGDQSPRSAQHDHIPFEIRRFERRQIKLFLVFQRSPDRPSYNSMMI